MRAREQFLRQWNGVECFQAAEYGDTEAAQPEVTDLSEAEEGDCHDTDTDSLTFEPESNLTNTTISTPHHFPNFPSSIFSLSLKRDGWRRWW